MHRVLDRQRGKQISAGFCALAIMTKAPRAGTVKTRLQPPLTPADKRVLAMQATQNLRRPEEDVTVVFADVDGAPAPDTPRAS